MLERLRVDAHLYKPILQPELLDALHWVTGVNVSGAPASEHVETLRERVVAAVPLRVLVAEDSAFNALLLEQLLSSRGHDVRIASTGRDALRQIETDAYDVLLLDVELPELDGFQVVQAIRERELTHGGHLPVIAVTAYSRKQDRERCLEQGMDAYLAKPIRSADLWSTIERVCDRHHDR